MSDKTKENLSIESSLYTDSLFLITKHCKKRGCKNPKFTGDLYNESFIVIKAIDNYIDKMCELNKNNIKKGKS